MLTKCSEIRYLTCDTLLFRRIEMLCSVGPATAPKGTEIVALRRLGGLVFVRAQIDNRPAYAWIDAERLAWTPF